MADKQSREVNASSIGYTTMKIGIDISDALTGLKALQREARKATQALRELEEVADGRSFRYERVGDVEALEVNGSYLPEEKYALELFMSLGLDEPIARNCIASRNAKELATIVEFFDRYGNYVTGNKNGLADYSTAELTNELVKREGVDEYFVDPHEGKAFISIYNGEKSEQITVDGPARIVVNCD
jgi:hypothetical protein